METPILPSSTLAPAATAAYATPQYDPTRRAPAPSHGAARCESAPGDTPSPGPRMVPLDSVSSLFTAEPSRTARLPTADLLHPSTATDPMHGPLPSTRVASAVPQYAQQWPTPGAAYVPLRMPAITPPPHAQCVMYHDPRDAQIAQHDLRLPSASFNA